jgi:hypothetical protein
MNVEVALARVSEQVKGRGTSGYVLTVTDGGTPHCVNADVHWDGTRFSAEVGAQTAGNATRRPAVSVLYPLRNADDYSLIIDGTAVVERTPDGRRVVVTPTRAVLHRNAPPPDPTSSCTADCVPLLVSVVPVAPPSKLG